MTADVIKAYQEAHPQHSERYRRFDVFAPRWEVEALTRRRLFGDDDPQIKHVPTAGGLCAGGGGVMLRANRLKRALAEGREVHGVMASLPTAAPSN